MRLCGWGNERLRHCWAAGTVAPQAAPGSRGPARSNAVRAGQRCLPLCAVAATRSSAYGKRRRGRRGASPLSRTRRAAVARARRRLSEIDGRLQARTPQSFLGMSGSSEWESSGGLRQLRDLHPPFPPPSKTAISSSFLHGLFHSKRLSVCLTMSSSGSGVRGVQPRINTGASTGLSARRTSSAGRILNRVLACVIPTKTDIAVAPCKADPVTSSVQHDSPPQLTPPNRYSPSPMAPEGLASPLPCYPFAGGERHPRVRVARPYPGPWAGMVPPPSSSGTGTCSGVPASPW